MMLKHNRAALGDSRKLCILQHRVVVQHDGGAILDHDDRERIPLAYPITVRQIPLRGRSGMRLLPGTN